MNEENKGYFSVTPEYRNKLPEARDISWDDAFFENDHDSVGIVAVFDFDYDQMIRFETQTKIVRHFIIVAVFTVYSYAIFVELVPALVPLFLYILSFAPFLLKDQVRWEVYAQHVAVTLDGIRFVNDRQKSCWGVSICDRGKQSKTVPYDKITDCDISEPAGNTCLCVPNVLATVNIDTASSGTEGKRHELVISGLKDPYSFKRLVWAMKRAKESGGYSYHAPSAKLPEETVDITSINGCSDKNSHDISEYLRDIRDELKINNELLREQRESKDPSKCNIQIV